MARERNAAALAQCHRLKKRSVKVPLLWRVLCPTTARVTTPVDDDALSASRNQGTDHLFQTREMSCSSHSSGDNKAVEV